MDSQKTLLVKEVINRLQETAEIEGEILTSTSVKEIYEINHQALNAQARLHKESVSYSGEVNFKIIYIDSNDHSLRQAEQVLPYRGFAFFMPAGHSEEPEIRVSTSILDVFVQKEGSKTIKLNAFLSVKITIFRERELFLGELHGFQLTPESCPPRFSKEVHAEVQEGSDQEITITID